MIEFQYQLFSERPTRIISDSIQTRIGSIKANKSSNELSLGERKEIQKLEIVLKVYICTKDNHKCNQEWGSYLTFDSLTYNEALCILVGVNPIVSDLLREDLFSITNESLLFNESLNHIFYKSIENSLLQRKFRCKQIKTQDFILWTLDKKQLVQISAPSEDSSRRKTTLNNQRLVDLIAREILIKHPNTAQEYLADDVSIELEKQYQIKLKPSTIRRRYFSKYPNF